ncbi:class I adenylate-forming enzyme family protein [Desulfoscipio geothermicus]|uniref:Long-chain acyl-CoA synthetase n=1 Tax=Desulfoscipio geothermicus DSM 3669 TaxID=1121426 RepID=A0A1I6CQ90_9FIRM|nr:long-chain-fatty-acid--CoA ligase [Desulfoscipio geothermicus]SFQ95342.1 long-chain acyl-CoA synthetase [Desulfoscipio geothermicus DSM 3669]
MNLADGLRINSWRFPDKVAAVFNEQRVTYSELNARANRLAHGLLKRGFKRGDKVSIILYNCIEFLEIYHALARIGVVSVPINFRLVPNEREYIVNNSDSRALFMGSEFLKDFDPKKVPNVANNCIIVGSPEDVPEGMAYYENIIEGMPDHEPFVDQSEEDLFYLGYTSGTTGFPKGAMIQTRGTLEVIKNALIRNSGRQGVDMTKRVFLAIMPICHSNSIWATLITYWMGGTNVIFPSGKFDPEKVLQIIHKEKVTTTSMVPTMITRILELPDEVKYKYSMDSLTSVGSSSAPLLTKTKEAALEFFKNARFSEGYGSTETGALTTLRHKDQLRKVRSIGKPNPGIEIKLIDEEGREVTKPNEVGVLWAKAPSAFIGYYKDPEKTKEAINGEWATAGDMAYLDEEGYYYLVDRKHDMIISGGENIYPAEIEEVLIKHPAVSEVAVIGVPHEQWGEEVKALIILKEGAQTTEEEILEYCKERLAGYKRPRSVEFKDDFPRTATGKVLKRLVKKPYWEGQERMI